MPENTNVGDKIGDEGTTLDGTIDHGDEQWVSPSVQAALSGSTVHNVIEADSVETIVEDDA